LKREKEIMFCFLSAFAFFCIVNKQKLALSIAVSYIKRASAGSGRGRRRSKSRSSFFSSSFANQLGATQHFFDKKKAKKRARFFSLLSLSPLVVLAFFALSSALESRFDLTRALSSCLEEERVLRKRKEKDSTSSIEKGKGKNLLSFFLHIRRRKTSP